MIIITVGLQKSGTGLIFNIINDILVSTGAEDIRKLKEQYNLQEILRHYNCNIGEITWNKLKKLLWLYFRKKTFVIKTHKGPTKLVKALINLNIIKAICIIRDPRDVILSAMDHGRKIRKRGEYHTFASCTTVTTTMTFVKHWIESEIFNWLIFKDVYILKYEDLLSNPIIELDRIMNFLSIYISEDELSNIYNKYSANSLDDQAKNFLHFNKGISFRYRSEMSTTDINLINENMHDCIVKLGYSID